jgi:hypothetical protein
VRREDLEHVIRAAADVVGLEEIVVVGSQAILAEVPDAPEPLLTSQEADVYPRADPDRAIQIEGVIGEGSHFHESFGYYAQGVGPETAKAPDGWEARLVRVVVQSPLKNTPTAIGWCLERHDIVLSKCVAGRDRDWDYATNAIKHGVVDADELLRRIPELPVPAKERARVKRTIEGIIIRVRNGAGARRPQGSRRSN